mmetsp:Transcript_346/g.798  ORF Transcript_346/g.798 Transcript_346/m.798 type:complete len:432 (-) Transcript_346:131-1426(-)|eukprot:CAMPEP_0171506184 /NCGR_PEP_ID=MMETSP0958-20121227/12758_1 /TAXON_ID=87120 /ORGANISM="Aurantiochytrium limacinum, Strain ATCCMYA-1381" /LENGTH=431 /DNA_ID=CAMNT_0012042653 /DNA_START=75 /DNA_END=1370 /DNA_ORIENTATION=-
MDSDSSSNESTGTQFGSSTPYAEPAWYNSKNESAYYNEHHVAFRARMRKFVDEEVIPNVDEWEANGIPREAYKKAAEVGLLPCILGWPEDCVSQPRPEGMDGLMLVIAMDELCRCASGGVVWGLIGAAGIGLPPLVHYASDEIKQRVVKPVLDGDKHAALAVSEAGAGSDVANLSTTAEEDGEFYVINGLKKWITGGLFADYFTVAARTGGEGSGMFGISLILVEKDRPGVSVRPMDCMGVKGSGTAFVEFDDVRVPTSNYIADVTALIRNFTTERLGIAIQANRFARECLRMSIEWTRRRQAFGKPLIENAVVRNKLAEMARQIEATHAYIESVAYRIVAQERRGDDWFQSLLSLSPDAAMVKVQATKTYAHCASQAAMLHGGNSYVRGGQHGRVESLYRDVLSLAIPGGAEDVMIDYASRLGIAKKSPL